MAKTKITLTIVYELLQQLNGRVGNVEGSVADLQTSFVRMESVMSNIAVRVVSIEERLEHHTQLLTGLRERVDALHGAVEKLDGRVGRLEQEYAMITVALRRLEEKFDRLEAQRLQERIAALENRVTALESVQ